MAKVESHTAGLEATQEEARKQATAVQQSAVEAQTNGAEQVPMTRCTHCALLALRCNCTMRLTPAYAKCILHA